MRFETILHATEITKLRARLYSGTSRYASNIRQHVKFRAWLLRRDERQRTEIDELLALVADAKPNALLDQEKIIRLQAQVRMLEAIVREDTGKPWDDRDHV